jgi:hypothetical protein
VRRTLERWLGSPSPADTRAEIARRLAERNVFAAVEGETRLAAASRPTRAPARPALRWAAAVLAFALLAGSVLLVRAERVGAPVLPPGPFLESGAASGRLPAE